jgi:hypothetical protein
MFDVFLIRAVRAIRMLKKLEQCSAVFNHRGHGDTEVAEVDPCDLVSQVNQAEEGRRPLKLNVCLPPGQARWAALERQRGRS